MTVEKTCEFCGEKFTVTPAREDTARFCSRECMGEWRSENIRGESHPNWKGGKVTLVCEYCGDEFKVDPHRKETARFCSRECKGKWRSENIREESHPNWKKKITKKCERCGKEFEVKPSRADARFCSNKCKYNHWEFNEPTEELAYLTGAILSDGCLYERKDKMRYPIYFAVTDEAYAQKVADCYRKIGLEPYEFVREHDEKKDVYYVNKEEKGLYTWLGNLSFTEALNIFEEYLWDFVAGYYDGDGNLNREEMKVRILSNHNDWLENLMNKLDKYVSGSLYKNSEKTGYEPTYALAYRGKNARKFLKNCPNVIKRKNPIRIGEEKP